jgi:hypothetical protein
VFGTVWRVLQKAGAETGQNLDYLTPSEIPNFQQSKNQIGVRCGVNRTIAHYCGMSGGSGDSDERGNSSDCGCGVGGGVAIFQAATEAPGAKGSRRSKRKLTVNVLRAIKEFKKKRKTAADEIALFRQSNVVSGDRVSMALDDVAGRNDLS